MSEAPNPQSVEATADPHEAEGIDAAAAAFAAMGEEPNQESDTQTEQQAEPDPEPEGESDTEAEQADPDADEPTDELAEVEYEGKTYKVPPELEKALLRQADYSRRMNEVSANEKAYTQRLESIEGMEQAAELRAKHLAEVAQIDAHLKQYEGIDWNAAKAQNPAEAALAAVELMTLQQRKEQALREAESASSKFREEQGKLDAEKRSELAKALDKDLPGWRGELGVKLTQYAESKGIPPQKLSQITDASVLVALNKARLYDELQASKPAIKAKAASAPPVTKPGAPRRTDAKTEALARHRKSGSIDSAADAFLAMGGR